MVTAKSLNRPEKASPSSQLDEAGTLERELATAEMHISEAAKIAAERLQVLAAHAGGLAAEVGEVAEAAARAGNEAIPTAAAIESLVAEIRGIAEAALRPGGATADCTGRVLRLLGEIGDATAGMRRSADAMATVAGATSEISEKVGGIVGSAFYASAEIGRAQARIGDLRGKLMASVRTSTSGDRRSGPRVAVALDAVLRVGTRGFCGRIEDLSNGGALFRSVSPESHRDIAPETLGQIGVEGIGNIEATVVSISAAGIHLRFERVEPQIEDRLQRRLGIAPTGAAS